MSDATLDNYNELVTLVVSRPWRKLLPQPSWGQDAALLAHYIEGLRYEIQVLQEALYDAIVSPSDDPTTFGASLNHDTGRAFLIDTEDVA